MQKMMKENAERPNSGHRPPNLHMTEDTHKSCSTCLHYDKNFCDLYDYRTQPSEVCDSWAPLPE
jgi:hypothetical protein